MSVPRILLEHISNKGKVTVSIARIAKDLHVQESDPHAMGDLLAEIQVLVDAGDLTSWFGPKGRAVVTLTAKSAGEFGLRLNSSSTRWLKPNEREKSPKIKTHVTVDGIHVVCESDMTEEPPGVLENIPDPRADINQDPDEGLARILAEERSLGLIRPTLALVGIQPWTAMNHERAPDAHKCDPRDDPRADPTEDTGKRKRKPVEPCTVCNGRQLRAMTSLAPVRVGKNRAARPPAAVESGEYCARCSNHFQNAIWPKVYAIQFDGPQNKVDR